MRRTLVTTLVVLLVGALLGGLLARGLDTALGIRAEPRDAPAEPELDLSRLGSGPGGEQSRDGPSEDGQPGGEQPGSGPAGERALDLRLVDLGGLGAPTDPEEWDPNDYSHDVRRFHDSVLMHPPYVDEQAFAEDERDFTSYLDRMQRYGNNGVVADGFLDLVTFDGVGDGTAVYAEDSAYRRRAEVVGAHKNRLWQAAEARDMRVYLSQTQLALTPPLREYLREHGGIDPEDPAMWRVYQAGLAELFQRYPAVDGIVVRIGEAGEIYDPASGLAYRSRLAVRTDEGVRTMLRALLEVAERYDRDVIFRSWTVGIGEVGELHRSPAAYRRILGGIDSPHLIVSTKYVAGDFYRFLPVNPTLATGDQRRIIEMQDRLEYEGFMAFPDLIGPLHRAALQRALAENPHVEGVWHWTQNGGPQQAGPQSLYPFHGNWLATDANVYTTSRFAADPDADPTRVTADWVRRRFGEDPAVVRRLVQMLALSRKAAGKGLYVSDFADHRVRALGLQTTPMMWIFEWDIVSGASSVLAVIHDLAADDLDGAIAEGREAVALAQRMRTLVAGIDPSRVPDPARLARLRASLDYEVDLLGTLAAWRATFLHYEEWLDTGSARHREAWQQARESFVRRRAHHEASYAGDRQLPAYNFVGADQGLAHAERNQTMTWLARGWLGGLVLLAGAAWLLSRRGTGSRLLGAGAAVVWLGLAVGILSAFLSVHLAVLAAMVLVVLAGTLLLANPPPRHRAGPLLLAVTAPLLLVAAVPMSLAAVRGPGLLWYRFWTGGAVRTALVVLATALVVWWVAVIYRTLRARLGRSRRWSVGTLLLGAGAVLVALGAVPAAAGLETMLTGLNDEMAMLPLGLSRILGITVHLGIPDSLPSTMMLAGAAVGAVGGLLLGLVRLPGRS